MAKYREPRFYSTASKTGFRGFDGFIKVVRPKPDQPDRAIIFLEVVSILRTGR